jgi:hypothetical protein
MRSARLAVSLLSVVLLPSCTDSGRVTAPAEADVARDGPSHRAIVHRDVGTATALGGGPPTNLAVLVGTESSIEAVCTDFSTTTPSPQRGILVEAPSGKAPNHFVSREAFVQVFEYSAGIVTDFCQLVGAPIVATGRAFFTQSGNQIFGPGSGPGSFAIHVTVHGIVDLTAGGQARLHGAWRLEITPDGTLVKDQEPVTLKPL